METQRLIDHIRESSHCLEPLPTGERATPEPLPGIRAVVFDIYGTLFISGSGDISLARSEDRSPAIMAALETAGYGIRDREADWSGCFLQTLDGFREQRKTEGIDYPEVRIEVVWRAFIDTARGNDWLEGHGDPLLAIVDHECRVNPCWPMPGLEQALESLHDKGLRLGIVSNAQFYTPLLFEALLGKPLSGWHFQESISVWSYLEGIGKPSQALYQRLTSALNQLGITPEATLYIGNDLRNDIWPAADLGFRTALFAGDKRSLRRREDDPDCRDVQPDLVITDLGQVAEMIS